MSEIPDASLRGYGQDDLLENAPCALALVSMDGTVEWSNGAFQRLSGLTSPRAKFFRALSRAAAIFYETQIVPVVLLRGSVKEVALELVAGGKIRVPVFLSANLQRASDGTPTAIRLAFFEATERRLYERDLLESRKSAEQLADVVRRALDAIVTLGSDGRIQAWNGGAEQTFGYAAIEVLGQSFTELLFREPECSLVLAAIKQLQRGLDVSLEAPGIHKDGRELDLSVRLTPHMEAPGILIAFSAILRDVSARKAAERALIQTEKLASVGRLASSIAHEINNPLEAVTNLLYLLETSVNSSEAIGYVQTAQAELARVSQIVTHTLRFHKQSTARTEANMDEILRSVLALYHGRLHQSGIEVVLRSRATSLFCFEGEIRQIIANLFSNAYDAVKPKGGRIELRAAPITAVQTGILGVRITVADSGPGIDASLRPRLFEPFVTTKGITGTGLGLWITRGLIEKNSGTIRMRTRTSPGSSGTCITVWLPSKP